MDTKQLCHKRLKEGFYPVVEDHAVIVELNQSVMSLSDASTSEEIIAAFDSVDKFNLLLEQIRTKENIMNGILLNNDYSGGKINADIFATKADNILTITYMDAINECLVTIEVTNTNGTFHCLRVESPLGGGGSRTSVNVVDNLRSTSTTDALSANQGDFIGSRMSNMYKIAKYNIPDSGFSLANGDTSITTFTEFIAIFDGMTDNFGNTIANPFTGMTLPANVNEVIEAFQTFISTYNLKVTGDTFAIPFMSPNGYTSETEGEKSDIIVLGFTVPNHAESVMVAGTENYSNLQGIIKHQIGINSTTGEFVPCDENKVFTAIGNKTLKKIIEGGNESEVYIWDYNGDTTITQEVYDEIKNAIENNKSIIISDGTNVLIPTSYFINTGDNDDIILCAYQFGNSAIEIHIKNNLEIQYTSYYLPISTEVLTKTNTTEYTPTADYHPATKKYIDDKEVRLIYSVDQYDTIIATNGVEFNIGEAIINFYGESKSIGQLLITTDTEICKIISCDHDSSGSYTFADTFIHNNITYRIEVLGLSIEECTITPIQQILTESEYTALGDAVNTDNVLYFVTPDA